MLLAVIVPVLIAMFQTGRTAEFNVRTEADRVASFFVSEVDDILGETERVMDAYMQSSRGSCAPSDLAVLQKHMVVTGNVLSMGIVSADGNIICHVGKTSHENIVFPEISKRDLRKPQFAELRQKQGSLPLIIKQNLEDLRIFAIVSKDRFTRLLLPGSLAQHTQIDLVLPDGGLWYTLTGPSIISGFSQDVIKIDRTSERFPVIMSMVVDAAAIKSWAGGLYQTLITIMLLSVFAILLIALMSYIYNKNKIRKLRTERAKVVENAHSLFQITYEPLINLETNLLVGVVARADLSIFDKVSDERPSIEEVLGMVWDEIGSFAEKRREFNLIIEIDGSELVSAEMRDAVIMRLKDISYDNLSLLLKWPADHGVDPNLYRPLENIATAGSQLAIECGSVRFSFLSDMWAWPYHQLVVDFAEIPESEEALNWMNEIVMNMCDQLHVEAIALGIANQDLLNNAIGSGFKVGSGPYLGPDLTVDALMAAVRHVQTDSPSEDETSAAA
ncbi:MAG: hypothetical protein ABJK39_11285 [Hyphomicrobiales bacterium]